LLDLLGGNDEADDAHVALLEWRRRGDLVVCEIVYSEVAAAIEKEAEVQSLFDSTGLRLTTSSPAALRLAGATWKAYTRRKPRALACRKCGALNQIWCSSCGEPLRSRQHLTADFIIGAHAKTHADRLLTTDRGFYKSYFKDLEVVGY
jgi:hypothetical protein